MQPSLKNTGLAVLFFIISSSLNAQNYNPYLRIKTIPVYHDTIIIDTMPIVPGSEEITGINQKVNYLIDYTKAELIILSPKPDSIKIKYRTIPVPVKAGNDTSDILFVPEAYYYGNNLYDEISPAPDNTITTEGSLSRSITIGTNNEAGTNTNFNLKFNGKLDDDINLYAVMSNNSMPAESQGTYSLQQFDKVYIKITSPKTRIEAGDISINKNDEFLKYFRMLKGLALEYSDSIYGVNIFAGSAKGIYNKIKIKAEEGNQGPYKLYGKNGEQHILIVPESEKVYLNGKRLKKGNAYDYIIDYSNAEITFTPDNIITRNSRIVVEFEYRTQNFGKFSYGLESQYTNGKIKFYASTVTEKDITGNFEQYLTPAQLQYLSTVGDKTEALTILSADSTGYESNSVRYCKKDTVVDNVTYTIFEYSQNPQCAVWTVNFSYVGEGNGDYVMQNYALNATIYKWVGKNKGSFLPVKTLFAPQKQSVYTLGSILTHKGWVLKTEIAISDKDKNLLSPIDDQDNKGIAVYTSLNKTIPARKNRYFDINANYKLVGNNFNGLDTYLPVEWQRDWNLDSAYNNNFWQGMLAIKYRKDTTKAIGIKNSVLNIQNFYNGVNTEAFIHLNQQKLQINSITSRTATKLNQNNNSEFWRSRGQAKYIPGKIGITANYETEKNFFYNPDTVSGYAFWQSYEYIFIGDTAKNNFGIIAGQRFDYYPANNNLKLMFITRDYGIKYNFVKSRFSSELSLTRHESISLNNDSIKNIKTFLGRYNLSAKLSKAIRMRIAGQTLSGSQPVEEYYFVEVPTGQGQYTWIDFNNDGQKQLNEFQITQFADKANYVRIILNSNRYIRTYGNKMNMNLSLRPKTNKKNFISKITNNFSADLNSSLLIQATSPDKSLTINYTDTAITKYSNFNILKARYNLSSNLAAGLIISNSTNKNLTSTGTEINSRYGKQFSLIWRPENLPAIKIFLEENNENNYSSYFISNNFELHTYNAGIKIERSQNTFQWNFIPNYKISSAESGESLRSLSSEISVLYNKKNKQINCSVKLINNVFAGNQQSILAYRMLEGLQNGFNITGDIRLSTQIMKNLYLISTYSLRKSQYSFYQGLNFEVKAVF